MSDDMIYRQDAINALGEEPEVWSENDEYAQGLNNQWHYDVNAIRAVPPAQLERKKGEWVEYDGDWLKTMCKCSECGAMIDINEKYRNFFCYHCGARMDSEEG